MHGRSHPRRKTLIPPWGEVQEHAYAPSVMRMPARMYPIVVHSQSYRAQGVSFSILTNDQLLINNNPCLCTQVCSGCYLDEVGNLVLGTGVTNDGQDLRVVVLRDVGEQMVHSLVVQASGDAGPNVRVVGVILSGLDLHGSPVLLDDSVLVGQGPLNLLNDMVSLEGQCKPVGRDHVGDGEEDQNLLEREDLKGHVDAVPEEEDLASPEHDGVPERDGVDTDGIVDADKVEDVYILNTDFEGQQSVEERHKHVLVDMVPEPLLAGLDATDIALCGRNIRVGSCNVGIRVVSKHVLVHPNQVRSAIEKVVSRSQNLPHSRVMSRY